MRVSLPLVLEAAYACWAAGDVDGFLNCLADDIVFTNHMSPEHVPFAGTVHGKAAFRRLLVKLLEDFEVLEYRPVRIAPSGDLIRGQIAFQYRHKKTGLTYSGRLRHVWRVKDKKIVRFDEYHDSERTRAFFELIASYEKSLRSPKAVDGKNGLIS
ncbi:MAG: nuclear transport factor 2 family protein [Hyphomicrobiaceae bacterium]|jgi:hypothetical protein